MKRSYYLKALRLSLLTAVIGLFASISSAQLSGVKTIPTDYASIAAFVTDLNTQGVGTGGVTLNVPAGYAETAPIGGYAITATGTLSDQIIITSSGAPKPIITANSALVAGSLNDAIFKIVGGDYITLSNLDLRENAANTTTTAASNNMTEWGIAIVYNTTSDGSQNCTIQGNDITLNRTYQNTFAIYANATHALAAPTTSATAIAGGGNNGLKIYGNTISNTNIGILVVGPTGAADHNDGVDIGGTSALTGNTITNYGTTGTFSAFANVSGTVNGILVRNSKNVNISYNTVTSSIGGTTAGTLNGIQLPSFSNTPTGAFTITASNNTISLQHGLIGGTINGILLGTTTASATSSVVVNTNNFVNFDHTTATGSGVITFINNGGAHLNQTISNNTFTNLNVKTTGNVIFITNNQSLPAGGIKNVNNNSIVTAFQKTGAGGTVTLFTDNSSDVAGTINNTNNNNFSNITVTGATVIAGWSNTNGGTPTKSVTGNTFNNWVGGTGTITALTVSYSGTSTVSNNTVSNITSASSITGISSTFGSGTESFTNNQVFNLSSTGASVVTGISNTSGTTKNFDKNKVYGLSVNNAGGSVIGISVSGGTTVSLSNNVISGLTAPITSLAEGVRGISITSTTSTSAIGVYYNTVYLSGSSSGANFGTSGIFHTVNATATTAALDLRNNIIINECVATGTGLTVAYRRSGTALNNYAMTSNRNLLYAGTPSATNLIFTDGTTPQQTFTGFQGVAAGREINSITGEAFAYGTPGSYFISLTGSNVNFLKPVAAVVTQTESGAANISSPAITTDYASVIRAGNAGYTGTGTAPDMGAFEFEGTTPAPIITLNSVTPPATAQCATTSRLVSVNITTSAGTIVGGNLVYAINGVPQSAIALTNTSGSTWTATLPASTPANATISWGVTATNSLGISSSYTGTTYADEPLLGLTAFASASVGTVCASSPTNLTAGFTPGTATSPAPAYALPPAVSNPTTDEDIANITISEGATVLLNNTTARNSLVGTIGTATGTAGSYANFTSFGSLNLAAGRTYSFSVSSSQDVTAYGNAMAIYIDYNRNGVFTDAGELVYTSPATVLGAHTRTGTFVVPAISSPGFARMRVISNEGLISSPTQAVSYGEYEEYSVNLVPSPSSVTWLVGATPVGTGNPLTVNPTVTTTYTADVSAFGCVVSPSPTVTVNVNPLPSTPTATNSAQCGTQIPTASVTSTSGLPTPTFIWYDQATGGAVLQSGVSTTYQNTVATTTTFYVSELNTATGCESARVAVTVTVALADNILASASSTSICIGSSVNLTATNTNGTPNQTYSYTWTGVAGSGMTTATGGSQTVTPTAPGTYQYDLTGVDGGCSAVSNVTVTVNPFVAVLTPVNVSCNGYNNGSFTLASSTCGTSPFVYSVDGGGFGAIPTNLTPGSHTVIVRDANMYLTSSISITITEPSTVINAPVTTGVSVCQLGTTANVLATGTTSQTISQSVTLNFGLTAQPLEVSGLASFPTIASTPNIISTATMAALPAGAVITSATLNMPGLTALGNSWQSDLGLGLTGAATSEYASGVGAANAAGAFSYTRPVTPASINVAGGIVNLHYYDKYNDNAGSECTFPIGAAVGTLVINYTVPAPSTISWWAVPTGGTSIGAGSPFNAVGTTVLPNTNTPGSYTLYAQGENGGCSGLSRTPVTVIVNATTSSTTVTSNCANYTWTNGTTYTASGTYTQTLVNANGCDSVATLNLTILAPTTSTTTASNCANYTWTNGTTYTASGMYTQTLTNAAGCDSIATLDLTILAPTASTTTIAQCGDYLWTDGTTYTASGVYTQTLTNAAGCDSIATLDLTILTPSASTTTIAQCGSYTWTDGNTYNASGMYTQTLTNAAGCDSIATLDLTINVPTTGTESITACGSYTWPATGVTYTSSGTQMATLTNAAGCDSIVTLTLTINAIPTALATDNGDATLSSSSATGNQWFNCTTNMPIVGATAQNYAPTANGSYAVIVTNANGCSDTSACVTINNVSIHEFSTENVMIYPNPATDKVTVTFNSENAKAEVLDAQGKLVSVHSLTSGATIDMVELMFGVYYVRLTTENGISIHKIVKQ